MISQTKNRVQAIKNKFENLGTESKCLQKSETYQNDKENKVDFKEIVSDSSEEYSPNTSYLYNKSDIKRSIEKKSLSRQSSDPGKKLHRSHAFRCDRSQKVVSPKRHGSCNGRPENGDFSLKMEQKLSKERLKKLGNLLEDSMKKENFVYKNVANIGPIVSIPDSEVPQHILDQYAKVNKRRDAEKSDGMTDSGVCSETENLDDDKSGRIKKLLSQFESNDKRESQSQSNDKKESTSISHFQNNDSKEEPSDNDTQESSLETNNDSTLHLEENDSETNLKTSLSISCETIKLERKNPHLTLTDTLKKALKQPLPAGPPPKKPPRAFASIPESPEKKDPKKMLEKLEQVLQKRESKNSTLISPDKEKPKEIHYLCTEILDITQRTLLPNQSLNCFKSLNCAITNNSTLSLPYTRLSLNKNNCCTCSNDSLNRSSRLSTFLSQTKCTKCQINDEKHDSFKCHLDCKCRKQNCQFFVDDHVYDVPCNDYESVTIGRKSGRSRYGTLNLSKSLEDLRMKNYEEKVYDIPCDISRPETPEDAEDPKPELRARFHRISTSKTDFEKLIQNFENAAIKKQNNISNNDTRESKNYFTNVDSKNSTDNKNTFNENNKTDEEKTLKNSDKQKFASIKSHVEFKNKKFNTEKPPMRPKPIFIKSNFSKSSERLDGDFIKKSYTGNCDEQTNNSSNLDPSDGIIFNKDKDYKASTKTTETRDVKNDYTTSMKSKNSESLHSETSKRRNLFKNSLKNSSFDSESADSQNVSRSDYKIKNTSFEEESKQNNYKTDASFEERSNVKRTAKRMNKSISYENRSGGTQTKNTLTNNKNFNIENRFDTKPKPNSPVRMSKNSEGSGTKLTKNTVSSNKNESFEDNSDKRLSKSPNSDTKETNRQTKRVSDKDEAKERRYRKFDRRESIVAFSLPRKDSQIDVDKENLNRLMSEIYETVTAGCGMDNKPTSFPTERDSASEESVKLTRSLTEKRKNYVRRVSSRVAYLDQTQIKNRRFRNQTSVCSFQSERLDRDVENPYSTFRSWKSFRTSQSNLNKKLDDSTSSDGKNMSDEFGSTESLDTASIDEKTGCVDIGLPFEPRPRGLFNVCLVVGLNHLKGEAYVRAVFPAQVQVPPHIENLIFPETLTSEKGELTTELKVDAQGTQCYSLILTDERGERSYAYCRRVLPEGATTCLPLCYCLIGKYRAPGFYYKVLEEIESHHGSSDVEINNLLQQLFDTDFPNPGEEISITYINEERTYRSSKLGDSSKCKTMPDLRRKCSNSPKSADTDKITDKSVSNSTKLAGFFDKSAYDSAGSADTNKTDNTAKTTGYPDNTDPARVSGFSDKSVYKSARSSGFSEKTVNNFAKSAEVSDKSAHNSARSAGLSQRSNESGDSRFSDRINGLDDDVFVEREKVPDFYDVENNNSARKVDLYFDGPRTRSIKRSLDPRADENSLATLLGCLGAGLTLKVFGSLLLERKVVIMGDQLSLVSTCLEGLQASLYPLVWQQPLISCVPSAIRRAALEAPLPLLAGTLPAPPIPPHEGMLIDLTNPSKLLYYQGDEATILPTTLYKTLKTALQIEMKQKEDQKMKNVLISEAFLRFFVDILGDFWRFFKEGEVGDRGFGRGGVVFDRESFIKSATSKQNQYFLEWFAETAMFNHFIQNMSAFYHNRKTPLHVTPYNERDGKHLTTCTDNKQTKDFAPSSVSPWNYDDSQASTSTPSVEETMELIDTPLPDYYDLFNDRVRSKYYKSDSEKVVDKSNVKTAMNKRMKLLKTKLRELIA